MLALFFAPGVVRRQSSMWGNRCALQDYKRIVHIAREIQASQMYQYQQTKKEPATRTCVWQDPGTLVAGYREHAR